MHLLAWLLLLLGCTGRNGSRPDIVLLLLEDLRADVLPPPAARTLIEQAGIEGVALRRAYAQSVHEFLSLGSLLTGRYVSAIPLCSHPPRDRHRRQAELPWCVAPPPSSPTMLEVFEVYGYRTALFTASLSAARTLVGEERHHDVRAGRREQGIDEALATTWDALEPEVLGWWRADASRPRLLVVEAPLVTLAMDEHWNSAYVATDPSPEEKARRIAARPETYGRLNTEMVWPFRPRDFLVARREEYLRVAEGAGRRLRRLLESLDGDRPRGTVLTSLHGMALGETTGSGTPEQTLAGRYKVLLERTLHVPLIVDPPPGRELRDTEAVVELVDLFPTLAAWAGARPPAGLPGRDLALPETDPAPSAYAEFGDMLSVRQGPWLLVFRHQHHGISSLDPILTEDLLRADDPTIVDAFHLHDVERDPVQAEERWSPDDPVGRRLREVLTALRTGPAAPPSGMLDPARVEALRAAGALEYW